MLVTTSLIYVLLNCAWSIAHVTVFYTGAMYMYDQYVIALALSMFVYTYNFYVYLITGKQFRADLLTLVSCFCRSSSSSAAAAAAGANANARVAETVV